MKQHSFIQMSNPTLDIDMWESYDMRGLVIKVQDMEPPPEPKSVRERLRKQKAEGRSQQSVRRQAGILER